MRDELAGRPASTADCAYTLAFLDWLACACGGAGEPAARAVRDTGTDLLADVAFSSTAGHVLDFDDTFADGVAHVSAATAPAALVLASRLGATRGAMLEAYAEGFEAMAAVAAASHPALYDGGWHPTAVLGPIGAVVVACRLLGLRAEQRESAMAIALLRAGGTRGAFGTDGKAIQVGLACAAGVQAALIARGGARVHPRAIHGPLGFEDVVGAVWPHGGPPGTTTGHAIERNWIKLSPSCLGTHAPIDTAQRIRERGYQQAADDEVVVRVHPVARQAAHLDAVADGLSAKFSIPYCVAHTLYHGPPRVADFAGIDPATQRRSRRVHVETDDALPEWGAVVAVNGRELARASSPPGAPERRATMNQLRDKAHDLAGDRLDGYCDDLSRPADWRILEQRR